VPCRTRSLTLGADEVFVQYYATLIALEEHNISGALESLHRAIDLGYPIQMVRAAPEFSKLLTDERFQHVLAAAHAP
jgi:hypothetical protein